MEGVLAADDQSALLRSRNHPLRGARGSQMEVRSFILFKTPVPAQGSGQLGIQLCAFHGVRVDQKAATGGIGARGKFHFLAVFARNVEKEIVSDGGGKY